MRTFTIKQKIAAAGLVAASFAAGTVAYAYWSTDGTGTGSASVATGSNSALTAVQVDAVTGLVPGGAAAPFSVKVTNGNVGSTSAGAVTATVQPFTALADGTKPACTAGDFTVVSPATPVGVLAGGANTTITGFSIELNNGQANQDNCKGVSPTLNFVVAAS